MDPLWSHLLIAAIAFAAAFAMPRWRPTPPELVPPPPPPPPVVVNLPPLPSPELDDKAREDLRRAIEVLLQTTPGTQVLGLSKAVLGVALLITASSKR